MAYVGCGYGYGSVVMAYGGVVMAYGGCGYGCGGRGHGLWMETCKQGAGGAHTCVTATPFLLWPDDIASVEIIQWPEMQDLDTLFESRAGMVVTENPR